MVARVDDQRVVGEAARRRARRARGRYCRRGTRPCRNRRRSPCARGPRRGNGPRSPGPRAACAAPDGRGIRRARAAAAAAGRRADRGRRIPAARPAGNAGRRRRRTGTRAFARLPGRRCRARRSRHRGCAVVGEIGPVARPGVARELRRAGALGGGSARACPGRRPYRSARAAAGSRCRSRSDRRCRGSAACRSRSQRWPCSCSRWPQHGGAAAYRECALSQQPISWT